MKVVLIGLGSMGKRRIRLMKKRTDVEQIVGIDSKKERRKEVEELYGISTFESIENASSSPFSSTVSSSFTAMRIA